MHKYLFTITFFLFMLTVSGQNDEKHYYFYYYSGKVNEQSVFVISTIFEMDRGNYTKSKIQKQWSETLILEDLEKYNWYAPYSIMPRENTRQEAIKKRREIIADRKKSGYEIVEISFTYYP